MSVSQSPRLRCVTITGADDSTDPQNMVSLQREFPLVEWGILFSRNSCGEEPRYPGTRWMKILDGKDDLRLSVHLCGDVARSCASNDDFVGMACILVPSCRRIQVNLGEGGQQHLVARLQYYAFHQDIVIQSTRAGLDTSSAREIRATHGMGHDVQLLIDVSGGRGIEYRFPTPGYPHDLIGFAGGITPQNVQAKLFDARDAAVGCKEFWIDMESGVRTDDQLDMRKVRSVLETCAEWKRETEAA